jgi:phosphatidate cytidylyltransferase
MHLPVVKERGFASLFFHMAEPTPSPTAAGVIAPAPPVSKARTFVRRLGSTLGLYAFVLFALFSGHSIFSDLLFVGTMLVVAGLGLHEFYDLVEKSGFDSFRKWGLAGGVALLMGTFLCLQGKLVPNLQSRGGDFETAVLIVLVLGLCLRQFLSHRPGSGLARMATTLFGVMYVPWLLNYILKLQFFGEVTGGDAVPVVINGNFYVLYFILVTKCSDLGAYCVGSLIGKHKMIPRVSPGKTWEGFGGAIVVSTGVSLTFAHFAASKLYGMNWMHAVILGVVLSSAAVVGDLIESLLKREAKVKDSGRWFPGIGGILDLVDSLLFNAPLMYLYLRHILTH